LSDTLRDGAKNAKSARPICPVLREECENSTNGRVEPSGQAGTLGRKPPFLAYITGMAEGYGCEVYSIGYDRSDGVNQVDIESREHPSGEDPEGDELQWKRSAQDVNALPAAH
jgi:hypothetical protein